LEIKHLIILAILLAIPFSTYTVFKENMIGTDSYYFLGAICNNNENLTTETFVSQQIIPLLPCNIAVLKALQYLMALIALIGVVKTAELLHKKNGWLAGLFCFLSPMIFFEFAKFETEIFAFPLLFWSNYFLLKGILTKEKKNYAASFFLMVAAGLIWRGAIYYLVPFAFTSLAAAAITLLIIRFYGEGFIGNLTPNNTVWESTFSVGMLWLGVYLFTIFGIFLQPTLIIPSIYWIIILVVNGKFAIHALPFLAIAALNLYNSKEFNNLDNKTGYPIWKVGKIVLVCSAIFMLLVSSYALAFAQPPTTEQVKLVKQFNEIPGEKKNGWSYGYWVRYFGGTPTAWGGGEWKQDYNTGTILTHEKLDCEILDQAKEMKLYNCNN